MANPRIRAFREYSQRYADPISGFVAEGARLTLGDLIDPVRHRATIQ